MEYTTYASRLRYLDAGDVDDAVVDFDGLDVRGPDGDSLGDLDGFIVDAQAGRVYYAVVNSGHWFSSKRLLVPVGHATLDANGRALRVDVNREALSRYPEFDDDRFRQFSDEDLRLFELRMAEACCPDDVADDSVRSWAYDTRRHYNQPSWWRTRTFAEDRLHAVETPASRAIATNAPPPHEHDVRVRHEHREEVVAREQPAGDVSPHPEGRAQPGDVLGLETGGERTKIGDTAEDENKGRRDAERAAPATERDDRPPRR